MKRVKPSMTRLLTSIALCCGKALSMWSLPSARSWITYLQLGCKETIFPWGHSVIVRYSTSGALWPLTFPMSTHQQTPESEATLLVGDGVLAVQAALGLPQRLHGHVPLRVPTEGLHRSVAAEGQWEVVITGCGPFLVFVAVRSFKTIGLKVHLLTCTRS